MKKNYTLLLLFLTLTAGLGTLKAQTMQIVYSDTFFSGQGSSGSQCTAWNTFRAQLTPRCYTSMTIRGTFDAVGRTCTDPAIVNAFAAAVNAASSYTSPTACNGDIWSICNRYSGEVWLNPPSQCSGSNCPGPNAYILRPCIGGSNPNWGGVNTNTCGGQNQRMTFIFEYQTGPTTPDTVAGPMAFCPGDTVTYSIDTVVNASSLNWIVPAGATIIGGQGSQSISVVMGSNSGGVYLEGTNICGTDTVGSISVTTPAIPMLTSETIAGADSVCPGDTLVYSITAISGASDYMWFGPAGSQIVAGQGTNLISLVMGNSGGDIMVMPGNSCGDGMGADTLMVSLYPAAMFTSAMTGDLTGCESDTLMFIAGGSANASGINWTVPGGWNIIGGQGTDTLWVVGTAGAGTVYVTPTGICGDGMHDSLNVVLDGPLGSAGTVDGDDSVCLGDTVQYSVPSGAASSYDWTVPAGATILSGQGDTLITVVWGSTSGPVAVAGVNLCGIGASSDLFVTVDSCLVGVDPALSQGVQVYPNPSTGNVEVAFTVPMVGASKTVKVFDVNGALKGEFNADWNRSQSVRLNLGSLPNGVYFVEFQAGEIRKTAKVVLSK